MFVKHYAPGSNKVPKKAIFRLKLENFQFENETFLYVDKQNDKMLFLHVI